MPTKIRIGGDVVGRYGMHRGLGLSGWFVAAVYLCRVSSWPQTDARLLPTRTAASAAG